MNLVWMPPRKRNLEGALYPQINHWLVDGDGRILACIVEPMPDNEEDSFDARLHFRTNDDDAYFISLEHAQKWCERETRAHLSTKTKLSTPELVAEGVVLESEPQKRI